MRANNEVLGGVSREISGLGTVYNSIQVWMAFTSSNAEFLCLYGRLPGVLTGLGTGSRYLVIAVEPEISRSRDGGEGGGLMSRSDLRAQGNRVVCDRNDPPRPRICTPPTPACLVTADTNDTAAHPDIGLAESQQGPSHASQSPCFEPGAEKTYYQCRFPGSRRRQLLKEPKSSSAATVLFLLLLPAAWAS